MSKNKKSIELPNDYVWKVLGKLSKLADEYAYTEFAREKVNRIIAIIRARDFNSYIAYCKSDVSLRDISKNYPYSYIVGERTLREIRALRLLTIFQKYSFIESNFDRDANAFSSFIEAENACRRFNANTPLFHEEDSESAFSDLFISPLIRKMKLIIKRVCGKLNLAQIVNQRHNGPGASLCKRGNRSLECFKLAYPIDTNKSCLSLFGPLVPIDPNLALLLEGEEIDRKVRNHGSYPNCFYRIENQGSALQFVEKNAETSRTISIEPTFNVSLQLGLDTVLKKRLKRVLGIDLSTQENNQRLAHIGSTQRNLVTVDLKAASDSVALKVLDILPLQWAEVFFRLRSHWWTHEFLGHSEFHKVSSMGNGGTFVLESLLFASACRAVYAWLNIPWNKDTVAVYGDDLVIHKEAYTWTRTLLKHLGFAINKDKTFIDGPVRESCGHDYYNGHRIDRFTCKKDLNKPYAGVVLHNSFFLLFKEYRFTSDTCDELLSFIRKYIPKNFEHFGPVTPDDKGSWLFCEEPPRKPFFHSHYQDWYYRLKRNEKYHPCEVAYVKKNVMILPLCSDGELPFYPWKQITHTVPIGETNDWQSATFFQSEAAKLIGCSSLNSVLNINGKSDVYTSLYLIKKVDVVRQTSTLIASRYWDVGTRET